MIKQIIPHGICLKCQGCCRFSQQDNIWSASFLDEEMGNSLEKKIPSCVISRDKKIRLEPNPKEGNFICHFLNMQDNQCNIYPFRPFECQLYPFLINRHEGKVFLAVDVKCPFVRANLESEIFKKQTRHLTHLFNNPPWLNSLKSNPQIIQAYAGAINLTEIKL